MGPEPGSGSQGQPSPVVAPVSTQRRPRPTHRLRTAPQPLQPCLGGGPGLGVECDPAQQPSAPLGRLCAVSGLGGTLLGRHSLHTGWPPATPAQGPGCVGCAQGQPGPLQQQGPSGPRETGWDSVLSQLPPSLTESRAALGGGDCPSVHFAGEQTEVSGEQLSPPRSLRSQPAPPGDGGRALSLILAGPLLGGQEGPLSDPSRPSPGDGGRATLTTQVSPIPAGPRLGWAGGACLRSQLRGS